MPCFEYSAGSKKLSEQLRHLVGALKEMPEIGCIKGIAHGIEKESLRVDQHGRIAMTPHPSGLGSPLTHDFVTTDFSEALVEFITPVFTDPGSCLDYLEDIHRFLYSELEDGELLWTSSMPCIIEEDEKIPLAQYGTSNIGKLKTLYRRGLGHRYSRAMQTIAGIHYNFSLPDDFWKLLQRSHQSSLNLNDFKTEQYFNLIRNFRRYSWLLIYLFGASPAICKSFIKDKADHGLEAFDDYTYFMPFGTSLRMGDLGYTSVAQSDLFISYNSLDEYIEGMRKAIQTPYPPYNGIDKMGKEHQQINSNILQIENEFYSTIRPKRVSENGERPIHSLKNGGVEYIEVRCLDLNPFLPLGIDETQINFLNAFLLFCLFRKSPSTSEKENQEIQNNFISVVTEGRKPKLNLVQSGQRIQLAAWAEEILQECLVVAELLDNTNSSNGLGTHKEAVEEQLAKAKDSELTLSAKVLASMREQAIPYFPFALKQSEITAKSLQNQLSDDKLKNFRAISDKSNYDREQIEQSDTLSFDEFLVNANKV